MVNASSSSSSSGIGFSFDNASRNAYLAASSQGKTNALPKATSTGTTIVGCIFAGNPDVPGDKGGIVLGADTRATEGSIVADKNCEKIHYIADNIMCCGAGTAADTEFTTAEIRSQIALHKLNTGREPRVVTAMTMLKQKLFQYQGHIGAALVLGGFDVTGPQLYTIAPHGSTDKLPYVTMGSGSLAAMAVFESRWSAKMSRSDAIALVVDAIESGIFNDLGSGSNVDVCVLEKGRNEMLRNYVRPNERVEKELSYRFRKGTTAVKRIQVKQFVIAEEVVKLLDPATSGTANGATAPAATSEMQVDA